MNGANMNKEELLNKIAYKNVRKEWTCIWAVNSCMSFFLNGKKITPKDLFKSIMHNHPKHAEYTLRYKDIKKPYFVGDYKYFLAAYKHNNVKKTRVYVCVTW